MKMKFDKNKNLLSRREEGRRGKIQARISSISKLISWFYVVVSRMQFIRAMGN
jgi:hypothetical protein